MGRKGDLSTQPVLDIRRNKTDYLMIFLYSSRLKVPFKRPPKVSPRCHLKQCIKLKFLARTLPQVDVFLKVSAKMGWWFV